MAAAIDFIVHAVRLLVLTEDHIGNSAPGIWVPGESRQGQVLADFCSTSKMKWS